MTRSFGLNVLWWLSLILLISGFMFPCHKQVRSTLIHILVPSKNYNNFKIKFLSEISSVSFKIGVKFARNLKNSDLCRQ